MPPFNFDLVRQRLDAARHNLLDTSLRNKLVNYRTPKATGLEIIGEDPNEVFRILATDNKAMMFTGRPDRGETQQDNDLFQNGSEEDAPSVDIYDLKLNTNETKTRLQTRLLKTWRDAQSCLEEQGVNVLFLALGQLEWYEADSSQELRRAPLVLLPVLLERDRGTHYRIRYEGTEVGKNLALMAKLEQEFHLKLPDLPDTETLDLRAYFASIRQVIAAQTRWKVNDQTIVLGFFSYAKYLMFKDLEGLQWPNDSKPWNHDLIASLLDCGFDEDEPGISEGEQLDKHRPIETIHEVCNADGSQVLAILEAKAGRSMVIEGPPGTGKSQTITNLIAEAIGEGKKVLFVSEKRAALDVVWRNLEKAGIHAGCLELHSNKTSKKDFYERLNTTVNLGKPQQERLQARLDRLKVSRDKLNAYCEAVHQLIEGREIKPLMAMGHLIKLGDEPENLHKLPFEIMNGWKYSNFLARRDHVTKLQTKVKEIGSPSKNPFYGSGLRLLLPNDRGTLLTQFRQTSEDIETAKTVSCELALRLGLPVPNDFDEVQEIMNAANHVHRAPPLEGIKINAMTWRLQEAALRAGLEKGKRLSAIRETYKSLLKPESWSVSVGSDLEIIRKYGEKWWRFLNGPYRETIKHLKSLCLTKLSPEYAARVAMVESILESQRIRKELTTEASLYQEHWGTQWKGDQSEWLPLAIVLEWVLALHAAVENGTIPREILDASDHLNHREGLSSQSGKVASACVKASEQLDNLLDLLSTEAALLSFPHISFMDQLSRLQKWQAEPALLQDLIGFNILYDEAQEQGIQAVADLASTWDGAGQYLVEAFERTWYEGVLREAFASRPALARFDRQAFDEEVTVFRELDQLMLETNKTKVALKHWEGVPRHTATGNLGILQRQFALARSHRPIRKIMLEAGEAIQAIKPVFMMSPLSVALYLPPGGPRFDLVIFDEASQIKPEDSFGSIIRAGQAIVVGDSKQMPPSSFFDKLTQADEDNEVEESEQRNVTRDLESILGLMDSKISASSRRRRDLRWHYRSLHDSLIAPSNRLFYKDRLVVFPTADRKAEDMGLVFHHDPKTVYGRGGSKKNPEEAKNVVKAIREHIQTKPGLSLGVVAFSLSQYEAISDELERIRLSMPELDEFDRLHPNEPLFIKNLENVQGDERDVIFISVGYGRDADGFISMNFGPINREGGERRLNVLITRARCKCVVFTNLKASDFRTEETRAKGVHNLKTFLHYAETGQLDLPAVSGIEPMSYFEEAVIDELNAKGYVVKPQIGTAGFFVDIGVCDPDNHDRFILGIECDGAKYHSAKSARDRDRLRQEVLVRRGWRIHRIWSTDWWMNRERELRRTCEVIEQALAGRKTSESVQSITLRSSEIRRETHSPVNKQNRSNSYKFTHLRIALRRQQLRDVSSYMMAEWISEVVEVESPVHFDEVVRRIREAAGLERAGDAIREAVRQGALIAKKVMHDDEFLWFKQIHSLDARNRSGFPTAYKKLDLVHPLECKAAISQITRDSFGITRDDLAVAVLRVLGFERSTDIMVGKINDLITEMFADEILCERSGKLHLA